MSLAGMALAAAFFAIFAVLLLWQMFGGASVEG
jgi:hypothetical protein